MLTLHWKNNKNVTKGLELNKIGTHMLRVTARDEQNSLIWKINMF